MATPDQHITCRKILNWVHRVNVLLIILCLTPFLLPVAEGVFRYFDWEFPVSFIYSPPYFFYCALLSITTLLSFLLLGSDELMDENRESGPVVRRALVAAVVVAYFSLMAALLTKYATPGMTVADGTKDLFNGLGQMVTTILSFYFGASAAVKGMEVWTSRNAPAISRPTNAPATELTLVEASQNNEQPVLRSSG